MHSTLPENTCSASDKSTSGVRNRYSCRLASCSKHSYFLLGGERVGQGGPPRLLPPPYTKCREFPVARTSATIFSLRCRPRNSETIAGLGLPGFFLISVGVVGKGSHPAGMTRTMDVYKFVLEPLLTD